MAALVLACKQIWGHVRTCATAVKMADLKYYSFKFSFSQFFFFFFFFAVCRTRQLIILKQITRKSCFVSDLICFFPQKLKLHSLCDGLCNKKSWYSLITVFSCGVCEHLQMSLPL